MLPKDLGGVVDNSLKVYGTSNLRVVCFLPMSCIQISYSRLMKGRCRCYPNRELVQQMSSNISPDVYEKQLGTNPQATIYGSAVNFPTVTSMHLSLICLADWLIRLQTSLQLLVKAARQH